MKYRIVMLQKYNGNSLFIAECLKPNWIFKLLGKIILAIPLLFLWIAFDKRPESFIRFFSLWTPLEHDKGLLVKDPFPFLTTEKNTLCSDKYIAEAIIKSHKEWRRVEAEKALALKMERIRKKIYIKVK